MRAIVSRQLEVVLFATLLLPACRQPRPAEGPVQQVAPASASPSPVRSLGPANSRGLSLADAKDRALRLEMGMTRASVESLLGLPDETSIVPMGGADGVARWTGLQWTYRWELGQYSKKRLIVTFQQIADAKPPDLEWYVNSWNWFDL
jgi:hypothetical protein